MRVVGRALSLAAGATMAVRAPRACMTTDGVCRAVREWLDNPSCRC